MFQVERRGEGAVLHIAWSIDEADEDIAGEATLAPGATFIVARRMNLPERQPVVAETIDGSAYVFIRLPYVSDPALVVTATTSQPVVHRGQRDNGAIVEVTTPQGASTTPAPGQKISLTDSGSRVQLRFPDLRFTATVSFTAPDLPDGSGTVQLGVNSLEQEDVWLIGAIAVALSPDNGVVGHADLKQAFARWRGAEEHSDGAFDRNVLRPALAARGIEAGPRMNKIVLLVERSRRTAEFPARVLDDVRHRLGRQDV